MSFLDKILEFCVERNISHARFEREAGLGKGTISKWLHGGYSPSLRSQKRAAAYMHMSVDNLMRDDSEDLIYGPGITDTWSGRPDIVRDSSVRYIPVLKYPHSGITSPEDVVSHFPVLPGIIEDPESCYSFSMSDSSMSPEIERDDLLIIRRVSEPSTGDISIVKTPVDEQTLCRKVVFNDDLIILQPFNRHYDPQVYKIEEAGLMPVTFEGKVIAIVRSIAGADGREQ